jgi:hypothetical protein
MLIFNAVRSNPPEAAISTPHQVHEHWGRGVIYPVGTWWVYGGF